MLLYVCKRDKNEAGRNKARNSADIAETNKRKKNKKTQTHAHTHTVHLNVRIEEGPRRAAFRKQQTKKNKKRKRKKNTEANTQDLHVKIEELGQDVSHQHLAASMEVHTPNKAETFADCLSRA